MIKSIIEFNTFEELQNTINEKYGINSISVSTLRRIVNNDNYIEAETRVIKELKEYGKPLVWDRNSDKVTCKIYDEMTCHCFDTEDRTEIFRFMKESSERMSVIFHNQIIDYKTSV